MRWCCMPFENLYKDEGNRGFSVVPSNEYSEDEYKFILKCRVVDFGSEHTVKADVPVSIISNMPITYCPWCGKNLKKWYGKSIEELFKEGYMSKIEDGYY